MPLCPLILSFGVRLNVITGNDISYFLYCEFCNLWLTLLNSNTSVGVYVRACVLWHGTLRNVLNFKTCNITGTCRSNIAASRTTEVETILVA